MKTERSFGRMQWFDGLLIATLVVGIVALLAHIAAALSPLLYL